ncbi:hypothetical protein [Pectobacterium odoriferum]|uniref:Uncharacterized protein n=1 Tax=Pectobacterium odoriferum TaxID=78398 RepID=A0ABR4VMA5_9GAMM|nr:hypothetical protein [Pectobacterium odoriferum]KGA40520.1 hypothetical protein KU75_16195 [Pectobacterium odoriferum]MCA6961775.1 hypothetical protein [Pectobacterium odoriferum]MCH5009879.1 hypothetical protein [Pectobacterium odoriferum]
MSDVRNIINIDNSYNNIYRVNVFNEEYSMKHHIPEEVNVNPGENKSTGGMWIPWCDNQKSFDEGHRIDVTFIDILDKKTRIYIFQNGEYVYTLNDPHKYNNKKIINGDSKKGKGEYILEIKIEGKNPVLSLRKE